MSSLEVGLATPRPGFIGSPEAGDRTSPTVNQDDYVSFLEEARLAVRNRLSRRWAVVIVAPDRVGLIADIAETVSSLGMNVEGATHSTVGGFASVGLVVSSSTNLDSSSLAARLRQVAGVEADNLWVSRVDDETSSPEVPNGTLWNVRVEAADRTGVFRKVTSVLADFGAWLIRAESATIEDGKRCVINLNVTLPSGASLAGLKTAVQGILDLQVDFRIEPAQAPVRVPLRFTRAFNGGLGFVSVVGRAKPGLIAAVASDLATAGLDLVVSTMAILEGRTFAIFAVRSTDGRHIGGALDRSSSEYNLAVRALAAPPEEPHFSTGELRRVYCLAQERTGVLATLSRSVSEVGGNIECVSARVIGPATTVCVVNMFVTIPKGRLGDLDQSLEQASADWIDWSVSNPSNGSFNPVY